MKIKNLFNAGIDDSLDQNLRTRVTSSNVVFIASIIIMLLVITLSSKLYWENGINSFGGAIPIILFLVSIGCLALNHFKFFFLSRLVFFLSWTILITAFPAWRPGQSLYGYFLHPIFGIISSTMALLMFSFRKETFTYVLFLTFSILITVFSFEFVSYFDPEKVYETVLTYTTRFRLHIYPFLFTLFFNVVLIYVMRINGKFFEKQQEQHNIIVNQNKQLDETRLKLEQANDELETRVRERTNELMEHNTRLTEYAFFHAHVLRAPITRIRGLLNLLNMPIDREEETKVRALLAQTMKELDETIKLMNEKLHASDTKNPEA